MFKHTLIFFSFFFGSTCAIAYLDHVRLRHDDPERYRTFIQQNSLQSARHALETHPAVQNRQIVQKDFFIVQGTDRQHLRIQSKESELIVHERKGKLEAVEKLQHLDCWLQELISNSQNLNKLGDGDGLRFSGCPTPTEPIFESRTVYLQQVRHLTAREGIYFYPSQHFIAQSVHMQIFSLPGRELPETVDPAQAFFSGTATEASFSVGGKSSTFTAQHLHASFNSAKGLP